MKKVHIFVVALLYFIFGKVSLILLHGHGIVNIGLFASEGISLAFTLFFGRYIAVGVFLGQAILAYSNGVALFGSLSIGTINAIEAIIGYGLFYNYFKLDSKLEHFRDIFGFVLIILVIQVFSAVLSNIILALCGMLYKNILVSSFSWWFGNVMGQLLITPWILLFLSHYKKINMMQYILYGILFGSLVYLLEAFDIVQNVLLLMSITIPITVLVVALKSFTYASFLNVILGYISAYSVYKGVGLFSGGDSIENAINYNLFILAHVSTVFVTGVLFEERRQNIQRLQQSIFQEVEKNQHQQFLLMQSTRLAQMGEMISMIAHQWRQPLNNLSLINQLLISKYKKGKLDDEIMEYFKENSQKQITLMSNTIDDFRNFFTKDDTSDIFSIKEVIEETLEIVQDIYKTKKIDISFEHKECKCLIEGSSREFGQVVLNILNNAKDVLLERDIASKIITIQIYEHNKVIVISFGDNGGGIDTKIMDKIFDPYFSTKENKNGTGLGLYMSKIIIEDKFHGKIRCKNHNEGAVFEIELEGKQSDVA